MAYRNASDVESNPASRLTLKASPAVRARLQSLGTIPVCVPEAVAVEAVAVEAVAVEAVAEPEAAEPIDRERRIAEVEALHQRWLRNQAILAALVAAGAKVFEPPTPLAIGISDAVIALLAGTFTAKEIGHFLGWWTKRPDYLEAIARGDARRTLDGTEAGYPDESHRAGAISMLPPRRRGQLAVRS